MENNDKAKMNEEAKNRMAGDFKWDNVKIIQKPESQWIDPEMTGPSQRDYFVWDSQTGETRMAAKDEIGKPISIKLNSSDCPKPINWREEHSRFDQINKVLDYCNEAGVKPEDLIESHKKWKRFQEHKAFKDQLRKDLDIDTGA